MLDDGPFHTTLNEMEESRVREPFWPVLLGARILLFVEGIVEHKKRVLPAGWVRGKISSIAETDRGVT